MAASTTASPGSRSPSSSAPSATSAAPAVNTAYELVHSDLLIGNTSSPREAHREPTAPAARSPRSVAAAGRAVRIHVPASTPMSVVAMAGTVLRMPSGSYTRPMRQMWAPSSVRSIHAARFPSLPRSPGSEARHRDQRERRPVAEERDRRHRGLPPPARPRKTSEAAR